MFREHPWLGCENHTTNTFFAKKMGINSRIFDEFAWSVFGSDSWYQTFSQIHPQDLLGKYMRHTVPFEAMNSRVIVYQHEHPDCDFVSGNSGPRKPAVASFLLYNVTLSSGKFKYTYQQPVGNGFVSTCSGPGVSGTARATSAPT